jgi:hypothetical protein
MADMYPDVLDQKQVQLIPMVTRFSPSFYLAGGTALAIQLGHRRSVDFVFLPINRWRTNKSETVYADGSPRNKPLLTNKMNLR